MELHCGTSTCTLQLVKSDNGHMLAPTARLYYEETNSRGKEEI